MDRMDNLQKDIELLQDNLLTMQELWDLREPDLNWRRNPVKYPFQLFKKFIRRIIRWILRPDYQMQIEFNGAAVRVVGDISRIQNGILALRDGSMEQIQKDVLQESDLPRVIQIVSCLNFGDAVGNDVMAIKNALKAKGIVTEIYTSVIHKKIPEGMARNIRRLPELKEDDIVIYHFAAEDPLAEMIKELKCKKVLRYHNVTPPEFFKDYDSSVEKNTSNGLKQVRELRDSIDYVMTVSEFNKHDLQNMGYCCPMFVVPILIQFADYAQKPSEEIMKRYSDGIKNIVFVGRIAPNKKLEDVIEAFDYYNKNVDGNTRLIIVGAYDIRNNYYRYLQKRIKKLSANNVIFTGHIAFNEILGYYKVADAFLCMSEHEGFCVPLVEAMYFKVPIVAYSSTAIPDTLNGCGILLEDKRPETVAKGLETVLKDAVASERIIEGEEARLKDFDNGVVKEQMLKVLQRISEGQDACADKE